MRAHTPQQKVAPTHHTQRKPAQSDEDPTQSLKQIFMHYGLWPTPVFYKGHQLAQ